MLRAEGVPNSIREAFHVRKYGYMGDLASLEEPGPCETSRIGRRADVAIFRCGSKRCIAVNRVIVGFDKSRGVAPLL
jgi:hypothetical protein